MSEAEDKLTPTERQFMVEHERRHALLRSWVDLINDDEEEEN
jgi:hypothetical protein